MLAQTTSMARVLIWSAEGEAGVAKYSLHGRAARMAKPGMPKLRRVIGKKGMVTAGSMQRVEVAGAVTAEKNRLRA